MGPVPVASRVAAVAIAAADRVRIRAGLSSRPIGAAGVALEELTARVALVQLGVVKSVRRNLWLACP